MRLTTSLILLLPSAFAAPIELSAGTASTLEAKRASAAERSIWGVEEPLDSDASRPAIHHSRPLSEDLNIDAYRPAIHHSRPLSDPDTEHLNLDGYRPAIHHIRPLPDPDAERLNLDGYRPAIHHIRPPSDPDAERLNFDSYRPAIRHRPSSPSPHFRPVRLVDTAPAVSRRGGVTSFFKTSRGKTEAKGGKYERLPKSPPRYFDMFLKPQPHELRMPNAPLSQKPQGDVAKKNVRRNIVANFRNFAPPELSHPSPESSSTALSRTELSSPESSSSESSFSTASAPTSPTDMMPSSPGATSGTTTPKSEGADERPDGATPPESPKGPPPKLFTYNRMNPPNSGPGYPPLHAIFTYDVKRERLGPQWGPARKAVPWKSPLGKVPDGTPRDIVPDGTLRDKVPDGTPWGEVGFWDKWQAVNNAIWRSCAGCKGDSY